MAIDAFVDMCTKLNSKAINHVLIIVSCLMLITDLLWHGDWWWWMDCIPEKTRWECGFLSWMERLQRWIWRSQWRILAGSRQNPPTHYTASDGQQTTVRIDLGYHSGNKRYAKYSAFQVADSTTHFRLTVSGYSGDAGDSFSVIHNGRMFSTKDRDHDTSGYNCASQYQGAWWYSSCHTSSLNGVYSPTYH